VVLQGCLDMVRQAQLAQDVEGMIVETENTDPSCHRMTRHQQDFISPAAYDPSPQLERQ